MRDNGRTANRAVRGFLLLPTQSSSWEW